MALAADLGFLDFIEFFSDLELDQRLFGRIDDNQAGNAVYDDEVIVFNNAGDPVQTLNRRDFQAACNDAGVGRAPPPVGDKTHNPFKLDLAGIRR